MKILITGATGFLGGAAARRFLAKGHRVLAHGRSRPALEALSQEGASVVRADLGESSTASFREAARLFQPEAIVHCAAKSAPFGKRREFEAANVGGTAAVLDAARACGAPRFVHVSTPSLYCAGKPLHLAGEGAPLPERPINHYAGTKRAAEALVRASSPGLETIILRPRALFGPGDTALFPRLLRALEDRRLPIIGDGQNQIDLTYIDNACHAIELALHAGPGATGQTFNITGGEPVLLWPLIERLCGELGLPRPTRSIPRRAARAAAFAAEWTHRILRRTGEPRLTRYSVDSLSLDATLDITAARRVLGYGPEVSMEAGIQRFVAHELSRAGAPMP